MMYYFGNKLYLKIIVFFIIIEEYFLLVFLLSSLIILFVLIKNSKNNSQNNMNISYLIENLTELIQNIISPDENVYILVKNKLKNRMQPFDFENELIFFANLISYKVPFSFIRFGD